MAMIRFSGVLYVVVLALLTSACASSPPASSPPASATGTRPIGIPFLSLSTPTPTLPPPLKVLRIGQTIAPDVLDPQKAAGAVEIAILRLTYEGLVSIDAKGNVVSGSADKWELGADGTTMTFHIREGIRRVDGTPITARDFEYALKRAVDPRIADRQYAFLLYDLKGAVELDTADVASVKPEAIDKALANYGVRTVDDRTLSLTFKKPTGYWQFVASTVVTFPTDRNQIDRDPDGWWIRPEGHNGNGAFKIRSIEPGKKIVLVPNSNYWRAQPRLERIEFVFYPNSQALLDAYRKGDVDIAPIAPDDLATIASDALLASELVRYPAAITYAIGFNNARKPFDDKNVRTAFSQAFDRDRWVAQVFKGAGKPYTRWIPPGVPAAQPNQAGVPSYNPKAAVQTLIAAGYAAKDSTAENPKIDCAKLGEIKLTFADPIVNQARFQFLADNWTRVIGCPVKLEPLDAAVYRTLAKDVKTKPMVSLQTLSPDYAHPQNWLSRYWVCGNEFAAKYSYCNKDLDALLARADKEPDLARALQLYQQAEDLLLKDVPATFAHFAENLYLVKPYLVGLKEHTSSNDWTWAGEWGPVWNYAIDASRVPASFPRH